jgi:3',5'-cyclic AMP phosphodiesterase CpdA
MPEILYRPTHRRSFIKKSLTLAGMAATVTPIYSYAAAPSEEVHWALLSDTHVAGDTENTYRGFKPYENLKTVVPQVLETSPQGVIINGDVARLTGEKSDYQRINELLDPVAQKMPVHMTMGNHDDRENFYQVFTENTTEVEDKYVQVIEAAPVRMILLDSLLYVNKVAGLLGKSQRSWLESYLANASPMTTLLFVHHTLGDRDSDLLDVDRMFAIVQPHSFVKAVFYGHSHQYQYSEREGIHLINLPAIGYNFSDDQPVGWVDAKLTEKGGDFTLWAFGGNRSGDQQTTHLDWR